MLHRNRQIAPSIVPAEPDFHARYIKRIGSGTLDMIARCREAGLKSPGFRQDGGSFVQTLWRPAPSATTQVATQDKPLSARIQGEIAAALGIPTTQVTTQVASALHAARDATSREAIQEATGLKNREHFRKAYMEPFLAVGWLERTIPDKPTSRLQQYSLTAKGAELLKALQEAGKP